MKTCLFLLLAHLLAGVAAGMTFETPQPQPLAPLLKKAEARVSENPTSADARYILARLHYYAFVTQRDSLPLNINTDGTPDVSLCKLDHIQERIDEAHRRATAEVGPPPDGILSGNKYGVSFRKHFAELTESGWGAGKEMTLIELTDHTTAALAGFRDLLRKQPNHGLYLLGLAYLQEAISSWKTKAKPKDLPPDLLSIDLAQARDTYLLAYRASFETDLKTPFGFLRADTMPGWVSFEAALRFMPLAKAEANPSTDLSAALIEVQTGFNRLANGK